jgi:hypothetical protein
MRRGKSDFAAFPNPHVEGDDGLTCREYAAIHLTAGLIAGVGNWPVSTGQQDKLAQIGVALADALMLELDK